MIVKSILLFLLLIVQYQIINKLFTLSDETNVEKWGSLITNLAVLGLFTYKYLQSFALFTMIERYSLIALVVVTVLVLWSYNYVMVFRNLFVDDMEPIVFINNSTSTSTSTSNLLPEQEDIEEQSSVEQNIEETRASYLKDFVGFGATKRLKSEPTLEERPYINDNKDFSKYYHKNRYTDRFDYKFNNLYFEPKKQNNNNVNGKKYHRISVKDYKNITDSNNYKVETNTKHIPEKMDHLITM